MTKFVLYSRLSVEKKSQAQHGFDSQMADIQYYLSSVDGAEIIGEYSEYVSGGADVKPELTNAMSLCRDTGATLLVAKLDRLSRRVSQIASYMESKVPFKVAGLPQADNFQLHIYAALAEQEREMIRDRVRRGMKAAAAKGIKFGRANENYTVSEKVVRHEKKVSEGAKSKTVEQAEKLKLILTLKDVKVSLTQLSKDMESLGVVKG